MLRESDLKTKRESDLKTKAIAINYCWDSESHLLRAGVDNEENLIILEYLSFPAQTLSSVLAAYTKEFKNYMVFTNFFKPLKVEIKGYCKQFDLADVTGLEVFYKNLVASERFQVVDNINLPEDSNFILCVSFLLNGLMNDLCGRKPGCILSLPTPTDEDIENIGYDRHNSMPWEEERQMRTDLKIAAYEAVMKHAGYLKVNEEKNSSGILTAIWRREDLAYRAYYSGEMFALHEKIFYASENSINRN